MRTLSDKWLRLNAKNLELFIAAGLDSFRLDIKAYGDRVHRDLTGTSNEWILGLPNEIVERDFVLEVSSV